MRWAGAVVILALSLAGPEVVLAQHTPAHATAEALNLCAQHPQQCITVTPSLIPTLPVPTATPTLAATPAPTDTPVPTATPSPEPCWLTDEALGDPDNGYIVFDDQGAPVPCPPDQPLPTDEPTPGAEPTVVSTATLSPVRPASAPVIVASQSVAAVAPRVVEQTVVSVVTATPTDTPVPTSTPMLAEPTPVVRAVAILPTATVPVRPAVIVSPSALPVPLAHIPSPATGHWEWAAFLGYLAAAIGIVVLLMAFVTRRRVAVWRGAPHV